MTVQNRNSPPDVIHHSDQGMQYAAHDYIDELRNHKFQISMSRKGNPYDNAFAESFMKTIKTEEISLREYQTLEDVLTRIPCFTEDVYIQERLLASLGYMPPNEFEARSNTFTPCLVLSPECPTTGRQFTALNSLLRIDTGIKIHVPARPFFLCPQ